MLELLDFYADWCGPCQASKPVLESFEKEMIGKVEVKKINIDKDPDKTSEFGVMSVPTFILTKDNKEIDRRMGVLDVGNLKKWVGGYL